MILRNKKVRVMVAGTLVSFGAVSLVGCSVLPRSWNRQLVSLLRQITGAPSPSPSVSPSPGGLALGQPSNQSSNRPAEPLSAAQNSKANAELLHEMFQVIFLREPKDRGEFGNWVDTLNQGASLEGVYNGLTLSNEYRRLELSADAAPAAALKVFGEELALLEVELPSPTRFDMNTALPVPSTEPVAKVQTGFDAGAPAPSPTADQSARVKELADLYTKTFIGSSLFVLKRVLGEEALKVVASKGIYREKLAIWYAGWVVHAAQRNVDFGVAQRNQADEAFHYQWAMASSPDRIKWEILNRLHRILNENSKLKQ